METLIKVVGCLVSCACCAAGVTFLVYLGIFAFNNPNPEAWYATKGTDESLFKDEAAATAAGYSDLDNVHGHFVTWFLWGFLNAVIPMGLALIAGLCMLISPRAGQVVGSLAGCGGCSGLAWYIAGLCWRFRASGKYASGDWVVDNREAWITAVTADDYTGLFQYASGNFMWVYFLITWILMAVGCFCSLTTFIVMCTCLKTH